MWRAKHGTKDAIRFRNPGNDKPLGSVGFPAGRHTWTLTIENGTGAGVNFSLKNVSGASLEDLTPTIGEIGSDVWGQTKTLRINGSMAVASSVASN